jgi:choline-sulfatase
VTQTDQEVGKLMECLNSTGLIGDTIVIYTSDHGDMCDEQHGMWWKSNFFEGAARVPFIASYPKSFHAGTTVDAVSSLIDVGPTLLDIAGGEPVPEAAGRSFAPLLLRDGGDSTTVSAHSDAREVYSEFAGAWGDKPSCMIRSGPWKLMYYSETDSGPLYNLAEDPDEMIDRSGDPSCKKIVDDLKAKVKSRWSAEKILAASEGDKKRLSYIKQSGGSLCPMTFQHPQPEAGANEFDFDQVPNWSELKPKAEAEWAGLTNMEE